MSKTRWTGGGLNRFHVAIIAALVGLLSSLVGRQHRTGSAHCSAVAPPVAQLIAHLPHSPRLGYSGPPLAKFLQFESALRRLEAED